MIVCPFVCMRNNSCALIWLVLNKSRLMLLYHASGIDNYIMEKDHGPWFKRLVQVLSEKASNQPDTQVEPGVPAKDNEPAEKRGKPKKGLCCDINTHMRPHHALQNCKIQP